MGRRIMGSPSRTSKDEASIPLQNKNHEWGRCNRAGGFDIWISEAVLLNLISGKGEAVL